MNTKRRGLAAMIVMAAVCLSAAPAFAERWTQMKVTDPLGRPAEGIFGYCVDMDSIRTGADGWTYYTDRNCDLPDYVFENAVRCDASLDAEKAAIRSRSIHIKGKSTPDAPWTSEDTYTSSVAGQIAKLICKR